ncbi:MAG: SpoIIE family protein phosphatase [Acidobacteriota bacterium]|nr:SpoIIE family protein phosphatase [Acidobacteriota bacterium]
MTSRWWWIAGAVLIAVAAVTAGAASESQAAEVFFVLALLWALAAFFWVVWRVWQWMNYRVGVRLFVTYMAVGVLPVLFAAAFAAVGLYILMGQYTSVRLGSELRRVRWELAHQCEMVLQRAETQGAEAAESLLADLAASSHEPLPSVLWQAKFDGVTSALDGGADLPEIDWVEGQKRNITARFRDRAYGVVSAASPSGDRVTAYIPLDDVSARAISEAWWFDVAFILQGAESDSSEHADDTVHVSTSDGGGFGLKVSGDSVSGDEIWAEWSDGDSGVLARPLVVWFRVAVDVVDLETGSPIEDDNLLALLRTSPANVWQDFTLSRYELGKELWGVLAGLGFLFLLGYGLALAAAAAVVFSIARSTARLTNGARQVERGNLDYRVPVKRRDQLGDLARSFNHMTASVQSMLDDVAEKERLARELELAREIQQRLLPASKLEMGPLSVRAVFQPAAEVGGDYFDVFQVADDRLLVTVGDVAGHGLSTGLLMASLKSSVAALVHEGYTGAMLIEKANRLLLEHGQARTMVTIAVIDIDPVRGRLKLANAGHPPPFLLGEADGPRELLAGALPMGNRLCSPASTECDFPPGARLLLYSDGLVEAVAADGEPFGYERLTRVLDASAGLDGEALISNILKVLSDYTAGVPLADDLTLLVIERCD